MKNLDIPISSQKNKRLLDNMHKMASFELCLVLLCLLVTLTLAVPSSLYPLEHRSDQHKRVARQAIPQAATYEYHIVPNDEYAVTEYYDPTGFGLWSLIDPKAIFNAISSNVSSVFQQVVLKGSLVVLGAAVVLGFCAFTPFCTLTINKYPSWSHYYRAAFEPNPLDRIENFLVKSLEKYNEIHDKKKKK